MMSIKYFDTFLLEDDNQIKQNDWEPSTWNYNDSEDTYNLEFVVGENKYVLKVFPEFEIFLLTYPDLGFIWCSFSALKKMKDYFKPYENDRLYNWLLNIIMRVDYRLTEDLSNSSALDNPNSKNEE